MVTFCKFPLKNFILSVFFLFQPATNCHQFAPPGSTAAPARLNQTPAASTPARQFQPPLFPPRPNGNAKKNYKPTKLSRFRTRTACGRRGRTYRRTPGSALLTVLFIGFLYSFYRPINRISNDSMSL
uniref:Uncharacterized protein n=1 Tax=Caudovirales sp. ctCpR1 TaxID=2825760 RepID=A0A8S5V8Z4_9CAUD|nr:MAG TPA: hypothetical protein [Caudovirales sp. ctCpR1]